MIEKFKKVVIVGAGEFALIAYEYFTYDSHYEVVAFSAERAFIKETELEGKPVVPFEELTSLYPQGEHEVFVAIPATQLNRLRRRLYEAAKAKGYALATYISSRAFVWRNAVVGENCFIFEHNTVQPFVRIGDNVVLWSGNHIGHRTVIEDHCFVSSHAVISGFCRIGESCFIGVNATINDRMTIARDCVIASGTLVNIHLKTPERIYHKAPVEEFPRKSALSVKF